uniref:Uncharacterized protein n=2 Tax=Anguilla anguilla TaxID=7936 RepID=A0A0E9VRS6_ANGAN
MFIQIYRTGLGKIGHGRAQAEKTTDWCKKAILLNFLHFIGTSDVKVLHIFILTRCEA